MLYLKPCTEGFSEKLYFLLLVFSPVMLAEVGEADHCSNSKKYVHK